MSTRANIHFESNGILYANIYRHYDGYPESLGKDLETFLDDVANSIVNAYFSDPEYLAAKFLVWQADQYTNARSNKLDFLGVAPCIDDHGDIEYMYHVQCNGAGRPTITHEEVEVR